jgi:cytochrome c556
MSKLISRSLFLAAAVAVSALAVAEDDPRHARHELMEEVGDAAKPVGQMLRGNAEFDAGVLTSSLETFVEASKTFGGLFPEGSDSGKTRAAPAIWEDRAGFDKALADFGAAAEAALAANPGSLEEAKPVVGPVFNTCRSCHEGYRLEEE